MAARQWRLQSLLLFFFVLAAFVTAGPATSEPDPNVKPEKRQNLGTGNSSTTGPTSTTAQPTTPTSTTHSTTPTTPSSTTSIPPTSSPSTSSTPSSSASSSSETSSSESSSKTTVTSALVTFSTVAATTTYITTSDGNVYSITSTSSSVVSSTTGYATYTSTPGLVDNSNGSGSSGLSDSSKKIVGGVVGGVGGAIFLGALALVAWRIWGRKRRSADEDDYLGAGGDKRDSGLPQVADDESHADRYTSPAGRPNAAANF